MGVLAVALAAGALALAGCYAPSVRDCTVSCAAAGDCATGQVCGSDGMCAAPEIAGRCAMVATDAGTRDAATSGDAAVPRDAAPPADAEGTRPDAAADAAIDAPATIRLAVQIMGKGSVVIDGRDVCSSQAPQRGNCAFDIAPGVAHTVQAAEIQLDEVFQMWTSPTCSGQGRRCTFTPEIPTTVAAKFGKAGREAVP